MTAAAESLSLHRPKEHRIDCNGVEIACFEWGEPTGQPLLLLHATGFHARLWDKVVAALPEQVPDDHGSSEPRGYRVLAPDLRGHGRSAKVPPYIWSSFAADIAAVVDHFQIRDAIGVGHSMGGHCLVHVAAERPAAFRRLLLVDPVILEPAAYTEGRYPGYDKVEDHPVARRREAFVSWEAMFERFADRAPYSLWQRDVLKDYCRYGVLPAPDGDGVRLACPALVEASVYMGNTSTNVHNKIPSITIPVRILRAPHREPGDTTMDFSKSPTWPKLASTFVNGEERYLPDLSHFIPMQAPGLVADEIAGKT